ncbi:MAG: acetyl-CoA C-acyltransferase [Caulobacterales bacterium]|nr:acetyl-CoA C-acyltransferase [Caulobacterales bacterium]
MSAYIYDAVRTPRGAAKEAGALHGVAPVDLVGTLLTALRARNALEPAAVGDMILGCVTQVGDQGGDIAKTSLLKAGWPDVTPGATVNRFCASALDACIIAANAVAAGQCPLAIGGGVESMSRVAMLSDNGPYYADRAVARATRFVPMGEAADFIATLDGTSRDEADAYAAASQQRACAARDEGRFAGVVPVTAEAGEVRVDETIREGVTAEKLARFEPLFAELGAKWADAYFREAYPSYEQVAHIHHVGNSPAMVDGASLVLIGGKDVGEAARGRPRGRVRSVANVSGDSFLALTGGIEAARLALARAGLRAGDLDLVEFNEAFAAPTLRFMRELDLPHEKVNVNGGAIAMGHPMGASGAMLLGTALDELERRDASLALIAISGAAGVGSAMVLERV